MKASYHTHTSRCHHAVGTEEEYIEKAIAEGLEILGFSDHAPMPYKNGYVSYYKMHPDEAGEYFSSLLSLREKYKDKIDIKIGFETEYYPSLWEECLDFWRPFPIDYLILGQHFIPEEKRVHTMSPVNNESDVSTYVDISVKAMNTGIITYVAHPDVINYVGGDEAFYLCEMRRLIAEAVRLEIPLEYNLLGMSLGRGYPNPIFWQEAAKMGAKVILGCDSHAPERVADKGEIEKAENYLRTLGITPLDKINLIKPF